MSIEADRKLQKLLKYDDRILSLTAGGLRDISIEWALVSREKNGQAQRLALRQALLYQLQSEISGGVRNLFLTG